MRAASCLLPPQVEPSARPGASRQVSLPIVNWWFSHLVLLSRLSPLPVPPDPPPTWEPRSPPLPDFQGPDLLK